MEHFYDKTVVGDGCQEIKSWKSENLTLNEVKIEGWMKKLVEKPEIFQKSLRPMRYYEFDLQTGTF